MAPAAALLVVGGTPSDAPARIFCTCLDWPRATRAICWARTSSSATVQVLPWQSDSWLNGVRLIDILYVVALPLVFANTAPWKDKAPSCARFPSSFASRCRRPSRRCGRMPVVVSRARTADASLQLAKHAAAEPQYGHTKSSGKEPTTTNSVYLCELDSVQGWP